MAIPTSWKTLEEVPEWAKADVLLVDGKYVAQLDGFRPKQDVDAFRESNLKLQGQVKDLSDKLSGALSAEESQELKGKLEKLTQQLESGADEQKIAEAVEKRVTRVKLGDREIAVLRTDAPFVQSQLKTLTDDLAAKHAREQKLFGELSQERLGGAAAAAYLKLPGAKPAAVDLVRDYASKYFRMDGEKLQPYLPDLEADASGAVAKVGKDGKPVSLDTWMGELAASGTMAGVFFDEARGPKNRPTPAAREGNGKAEKFGSDRIAAALEKRRSAASA